MINLTIMRRVLFIGVILLTQSNRGPVTPLRLEPIDAIPPPVLRMLHPFTKKPYSANAYTAFREGLRNTDALAGTWDSAAVSRVQERPSLQKVIAQYDSYFRHGDTHHTSRGYTQISGLVSHPPLRDEIAKRIAGELKAEDRILSIGAGSGLLEEEIRAQAPSAHILALDPTLSVLRRAQGRALTAVNADGQHLPFTDQSMDVIVMPESLGYMDVPQALREAFRVLKPGGRLFVIHYGTLRMVGGLIIHRRDTYVLQSAQDLIHDLQAAGYSDSHPVELESLYRPDQYYMIRAAKPQPIPAPAGQRLRRAA